LNSTTRGRVAFDLKTVGLLHFASSHEMREEKELRMKWRAIAKEIAR
jgi:hypothetical protein